MAVKQSIAGLLLATLLTTACQRAATNPLPRMDIHQPFKTNCIGRFLIDLPEEFGQLLDPIDGLGDTELFYGRDKDFKRIYVAVPNQRKPGTEPVLLREDFNRMVRGREQELKTAKNKRTGLPMLLNMERWGSNAVIFRRYANGQVDGYFVIELHLLADDIRYTIFRTDVLEFEDMESEESRLKALAAQTRTYTDPEAAGPGFCVKGVVLNDVHDEETAMFNFQSESHKDLLFEVYSRALVRQDEGLLARVEGRMEGAPLAMRLALHTLRKGKRKVAGMEAEELLEHFKEKGYRMQGFTMETRRSSPAYMQPQMSLELTGGGQISGADYVDSSLSNDEALELWDKVVSSIRPRPGAVEGEKR
ncbi:T6SS immunity protein Tli4 family protein [Cupriavidus necator]|uniref:T6SS immunity protein Tli4 family protein n=1 Tax=Cupriavidus necator TaxID=106590 RepID=UPI003F734379